MAHTVDSRAAFGAQLAQPDPDLLLDTTAADLVTLAGATASLTTVKAAMSGAATVSGNRAVPAVGAMIGTGGQSVLLCSLFKLPTGPAAPRTLVLNLLDRIEYTAGYNLRALGALVGNNTTANFALGCGDAAIIGVSFTYQAATGRYLDPRLGYLDQVKYTLSSNINDQVSVSLYASTAAMAANYAGNSYVLMSNPAVFAYQASVSVSTQAVAGALLQATGGSVVNAALALVGHAWNDNGCWILASTIADMAGASLPATSTSVGIKAQANGEWSVAYDGTVAANANWTSLLKPGEIVTFVTFVTRGGGGHITTVVGGSGTAASLIDNAAFINANGSDSNSADDGLAPTSPSWRRTPRWTNSLGSTRAPCASISWMRRS